MRENWQSASDADLAQRCGRTLSAIQAKRCKMGLTGKAKGPNSGSFTPGMTPWNAGMRGFVPPRSRKTCFRPGNVPHNAHEPGKMYIRKDNDRAIWYIKPHNSRRVEPYHRWRWKQMYGEIPDGHVVVFENGDTMNISDHNLQLLSRRENMSRNMKKIDAKHRANKAAASRKGETWAARVAAGKI